MKRLERFVFDVFYFSYLFIKPPAVKQVNKFCST